MNEIDDLLINIEVDTKKAAKGMSSFSKELGITSKQAKQIEKELDRLNKQFSGALKSSNVVSSNKQLTLMVAETDKVSNSVNKLNTGLKDVGKNSKYSFNDVLVPGVGIALSQIYRLDIMLGRLGLTLFSIGQGFKRGFAVTHADKLVLSLRKVSEVIRRDIETSFYAVPIRSVKKLSKESMEEFRSIYGFFNRSGPLHLINKTDIKDVGEIKEQLDSLSNAALRSGVSAFRDLGDEISLFKLRAVSEFDEAFKAISSRSLKERFFAGVEESFLQVIRARKAFEETLAGGKGFEFLKERAEAASLSLNKFFSTSTAGAQQVGVFKQLVLSMQFQVESLSKTAKSIGVGFVNGFKAIPEVTKATMSAIYPLNTLVAVTSGNLKEFAKVLSKSFAVNIITIAELSALLGPVLEKFGEKLQESDHALVRFAGSVLKVVGILSGKFVSVISFALSGLGKFIESIGDKLIASTADAEKSFIKLNSVMNTFNFAIRGFNRVLGTESVGSVERWTGVLEDLNRTSIFTRESLAKGIKLLVVEGANLNLGVKQTEEILRRSADVASVIGEDFTDTVQRIVSALNGQASALNNVGINLTATGLEHSKLTKTMGLHIDQMNSQEMVLLKVNELFKQSAAFIGGAKNELESITGAQAVYNKTVAETEAIFGESAIATRAYLVLQIKLLTIFRSMPRPIIKFLGALKDIAGVTLKITGSLLKVTFFALGLVTAFKGLNFVLSAFFGVTFKLSGILSFFLKRVVPLVLVLVTLKKAFDELLKIKVIQGILKNVADTFTFFNSKTEESAGFMEAFSEAVERAFKVLVDFTKIAITGLIQGMLALQVAYFEFRKAMTSNETDILAYDLMLTKLDNDIGELTKENYKGVASILSFGEETAVAAEDLGLLNSELLAAAERSRKFKEDVKALALEMNKGFDKAAEKRRIFGDEFDAVAQDIIDAQKKINAVFDVEEDREKTAKRLMEAQNALTLSRFQAEKLKLNTLKDFAALQKDLTERQLTSEGQNAELIRIRMEDELKALNLKVAQLKKLGTLNKDELASVEKIKAAIVKIADIDIAKVYTESLQKSSEVLGKLVLDNKALEDEIIKAGLAEEEQVKRRLQDDLKELDNLKAKLFLEGTISKEILDQIEKRKELLKQQSGLSGAFTIGDLGEQLGNAFAAAKSAMGSLFSGDGLTIALPSQGDLLSAAKTMGEGLKQSFLNIDLKKAGSNIGKGLWAGAKAITGFFDPDMINKFGDFIGDFLQRLPENLSRAFNKLIGAMSKFIESFPQAVQKILDQLPGIIQKLLDQAPKLITSLMDSLGKVLDKLPFLVARILDKLPDILSGFLKQLPSIVLKLFDAIGKIIAQLIQSLPEVLTQLFENFDEFVGAFVEGLIAAMGDIVAAFVDLIVGGGMEKIVGSFLRMIPRVVGAIVSGIWKGLVRAFQSIFGGIKLPESITELPGKFTEGIKNLSKKATEEAGKLFQVLDLEAAAKGQDQLDKLQDIFNIGLEKMNITFKGLFDGLVAAWRWVLDHVINPLVNGLTKVWNWVDEKIIQPLASVVEKAWQWVIDKVITPIAGAVSTAWQWVVDKIIEPLAGVVSKAFMWVKENILDKFGAVVSKAFDGAKDFGTKIWDGLKEGMSGATDFLKGIGGSIWDGLKSGFDTVSNLFSKMFNTSGAWGKGHVEDVLTGIAGTSVDIPFLKFARGGQVPGVANFAGDNSKNDKVAAMLSPGEVVIPRSLMKDPIISSIVDGILSGTLRQMKFGGYITQKVESAKVPSGGVAGDLLKGDVQGALSQLDPSSIDPSKLWDDVLGKVTKDLFWKMLDMNKFHMGGLVPAFANGGEVPSMLQSGEFVINRAATKSLGLDFLKTINATGSAPGGSEVNIEMDLTVNTTETLDENFVRTRLMPSIKKELKQASLKGEFIMSERGIK